MMQKITVTDPYGNLRTVECEDITKEEYDSHPGPEYTTTVVWNPHYQNQFKGGDTMYGMWGQINQYPAKDNEANVWEEQNQETQFKQNIAQPVKPNEDINNDEYYVVKAVDGNLYRIYYEETPLEKPDKSKDNGKSFVITYLNGTKIYVPEYRAPKLKSKEIGTGYNKPNVTVHNVFGNYIQPRKSQPKKVQPKGRGGYFSNLVSKKPIYVDSGKQQMIKDIMFRDQQEQQIKNQQRNQQSLVGNNSCACGDECCKCHNHEHHQHDEKVTKNNNVGGIDLSTIKVAVMPDGLFAHWDTKDNTFKLLNQHELDVHHKYGVEFVDFARTPEKFKQMAQEEHYSCIDPRLKQPGELWKK